MKNNNSIACFKFVTEEGLEKDISILNSRKIRRENEKLKPIFSFFMPQFQLFIPELCLFTRIE